MNSYIAFYKNKKMEVKADTSYGAQLLASKAFKAKKSYDVSVVLVGLNGSQVAVSTAGLG